MDNAAGLAGRLIKLLPSMVPRATPASPNDSIMMTSPGDFPNRLAARPRETISERASGDGVADMTANDAEAVVSLSSLVWLADGARAVRSKSEDRSDAEQGNKTHVTKLTGRWCAVTSKLASSLMLPSGLVTTKRDGASASSVCARSSVATKRCRVRSRVGEWLRLLGKGDPACAMASGWLSDPTIWH